MTATASQQTIAVVVTVDPWTDRKGRYHEPRTGHADPKCRGIVASRVVDHDVPFSDARAGWPCGKCWIPPESGATDGPTLPRPAVVPPSDGQRGSHASGSLTPAREAPEPEERPSPARLPADEPHDSTVPSARPTLPRPNRFGGRCSKCGSWVQAGAGLLTGGPGNWGTVHRDGDCQPEAGRATNEAITRREGLPNVPAGHYCVDTPAGDVFLRVDRPDEGPWAGGTFVKEIHGGRPTGQKVPRARQLALLVMVEGQGVEACARAYGRKVGRCSRCNRLLTDPTSRQLGIGPECRGDRKKRGDA